MQVGILGATGTVGQRFAVLLESHPCFKVAVVAASNSSRGKLLGGSWRLSSPCPAHLLNLALALCNPECFTGCRIIFSALDEAAAVDIEQQFVAAGFFVLSNASRYRMHSMVPLVVPTANPHHLLLLHTQQKYLQSNNLKDNIVKLDNLNDKDTKLIENHTDLMNNDHHTIEPKQGWLVCNANCSTTALVVALKPLQEAFGPLESVMVTTMQAISGAGYPGVPSLDILGNVVPYIGGEEAKIETETCKILGILNDSHEKIIDAQINISAMCNRVAVVDGHTECVSVRFKNQPAPSLEQIKKCWTEFKSPYATTCHYVPKHPVLLTEIKNRPQPRLDVDVGNGMCVVVGGIRECNVFDVKFTLLCHNTVLGAAGSAIMNAEIAVAMGLVI